MKFSEKLFSFIKGVGSIVNLFPILDSHKKIKKEELEDDFETDCKNLRSDFEKVIKKINKE